MALWLGVFALSFAAEFASDSLSAFYQTAVRKLWRRKAVQWGLLLGALGWVDLGGIAAGWPLSALFLGSLTGGAAGTWFAVSRMTITARLKAKQRRERALSGMVRGSGEPGGTGGDPAAPPLLPG